MEFVIFDTFANRFQSVLAVLVRLLCVAIAVPRTPATTTRDLPRIRRHSSHRLTSNRSGSNRYPHTNSGFVYEEVIVDEEVKAGHPTRPQPSSHRVTFADNSSTSNRSPNDVPAIGLGQDASQRQPLQSEPLGQSHDSGKTSNPAVPLVESPAVSSSEDVSRPGSPNTPEPIRDSSADAGKTRSRSRCPSMSPRVQSIHLRRSTIYLRQTKGIIEKAFQ